MVRNILEQYGYTVFEADSGTTALEVWEIHRHRIDLLLTDMVMPQGLSGSELAVRLQREKPGLRVVLTSGYSKEMIGKDSGLHAGRMFLQKPYHPLSLVQVVRDALDSVE